VDVVVPAFQKRVIAERNCLGHVLKEGYLLVPRDYPSAPASYAILPDTPLLMQSVVQAALKIAASHVCANQSARFVKVVERVTTTEANTDRMFLEID
jgi:hypothetical protein